MCSYSVLINNEGSKFADAKGAACKCEVLSVVRGKIVRGRNISSVQVFTVACRGERQNVVEVHQGWVLGGLMVSPVAAHLHQRAQR